MNETKQRIAIAEACGWKCESPEDLPDYLNDLNAMHDAEETLSDEANSAGGGSYYSQRMRFSERLNHVVNPSSYMGGSGFANLFPHVHATAKQRAEAFLRTLNLWEEEA